MRRLLVLVLTALSLLSLAACGGAGTPPAPTAAPFVQGTVPVATETTPADTVAAPTAEETATATEALLPTAEPATESALTAAGADPLLRAYRSMVAIQVNAALVGETVAQVQAGRIDPDEMPVAALALGALTQSVDEGLPGITPPAALAAQWDAAVALHEEVKALGARWLIGQMSVAEVAAAMDPIQAELERLVAESDAAVASEYGVSAAELTEHRVRLVEAVGGVFE